MYKLFPGVTPAGQGIDNISWNILGQTYVPKHLSDSSFSWHATFPPGTFVPPHIHPTQDEFIYLLEGQLELLLDGKDASVSPGDLIKLPMGIPHGIFNKSDRTVKCLFWVSPARRLYDLFWGIHNLADQNPADVVALSAKHEVDFLPPPDAGGHR
jgi:quercetin dioxygenase-like cupin family protein